MANITYNINTITSGSNYPEDFLSADEQSLVQGFDVNNLFDPAKNFISLDIKTIQGSSVQVVENLTSYSLLSNAQAAGKSGASVVTLDPVADIIDAKLEGSDLILDYKFLNNPFTTGKFGSQFFVKEIAPDRTEIRLLSSLLTDSELEGVANTFIDRFNSDNTFKEFYVQSSNELLVGLNIRLDSSNNQASILVKLDNPLPVNYEINSIVTVVENVAEPAVFECLASIIEEPVKLTKLRGPNFNVDLSDQNTNTTDYQNFNQLFSYPVTSSYYELYSLFNENSAQISINHNEYSDFIHFSSAEERLRNFKYKLDLIHSYEDSLYSASLSGRNLTGISGSKEYYDGLISGIVNNFDHYDRFLYYESGSNSWPKENNTKPHKPLRSSITEANNWFNTQIISASNYDVTNFDILTNTIPTFIREDSNNEPYLMFIHMIAQHFDNLWIYFKAVSDKYDADNRLNFGISKDLVKDAIESFGVKLYDSNASLDNLFSSLVGERYNTGSEQITDSISALSGSSNSYLQPVSKDSYTKEIYKRIYHNLPYLIKTKGTYRGLRALITCYGIPDDILEIKYAPGVKVNTEDFFGPQSTVTSSNASIRLDNTGSVLSGSTLSVDSSIRDTGYLYSKDTHQLQIGFNINKEVNERLEYITSGAFNIDEYFISNISSGIP